MEPFPIVPESIEINSRNTNLKYEYELLEYGLKLFYNDIIDTILITYRTIPIRLNADKSLLDSASVNQEDRIILIEQDYTSDIDYSRKLIQSQNLEYSGSFSRGVSFGNNQDVVLNSNFNLQMRGDLGNGLEVRAAISDENIPIQPEGNTQVLQEFDKIFLEIKKDKTYIIAGDYELASPESYFMNYYKKLKGLSLQTETKSNSWSIENKGSFAVSRGKFRRIELITQEGNQGPYKLDGANGEIFLQILSGTEKIYADGQLLKRGENYDYTIDYNRAEIRFTTNRIITSNLRIIVEFEYSVQSYLRSLYATSSTFRNKKWELNLSLYSEQDSKTLSSNLELDSTDLNILNTAGDDSAFRNGIFTPSSENRDNIIKYTQTDDILFYSPRDTSDFVGAVFSNVGLNKGSYIIDNEAAANGRVYKHVGLNMGNYDPVVQIVAPEKKQLLSFRGQYNLSDSTSFMLEGAVSNQDKNRFSELGNQDDIGYSIFSKIDDTRRIGSQAKWLIKSHFSMEKMQKNFRALNPYRNTEFNRDWNISTLDSINNQLLLNSSIDLSNSNYTIRYGLGIFDNKSIYEGTRHQFNVRYSDNDWLFQFQGDLLNSESQIEKSRFFRPKVNIQKTLFNSNWSIGLYFEKEENLRRNLLQSDSLSSSSFDYDLYRFFIEKKNGKNWTSRWSISKRADKRVIGGHLENVTNSLNFEYGGKWKQSSNSDLIWQLTLRDYKVENNYLEEDNSSRSFIGTIDHQLKLFENGLVLNSFFESNSGQEPKFEFQYIKVQKGEGSYVWNDYNLDSLQQINEFVIAPFSDQAEFEKISVFNNEFISTNRNIFNQSIKIEPRKFLKSSKSIFSKFIISSRYRIDQKSLSQSNDNLVRFINFDFSDTTIVSNNSAFDHNLFFNRGNPEYDIQLSYRTLDNKFVQITGFERRSSEELYTRLRINLQRKLDMILESRFGQKDYDSENFDVQDFDIDFYNITPQLNYRPFSNTRFILKYKFEKNSNSSPINENSKVHDLGLDLTWRQASNSNLQVRFNYVIISFDGASNSPIEFEMLQGLKDGQNYLWNINYTKRLSNNIDLIINYEGRKSEGNKLVNTAGVQMRAIF